MEQLFDELFTRFRDYQEAIDSEPPPAIYGQKKVKEQLKEWEIEGQHWIDECKGKAIDALNDYIDKRMEIYLEEYGYIRKPNH